MVKCKKVKRMLARKDKEFGHTALHFAAGYNRPEVVKLLLTFKADVNAVGETEGATPLHLAATFGHVKVVKVLLSHPEIDVDIKERKYGGTPLHCAALRDGGEGNGHRAAEVAKLLLSHKPTSIHCRDKRLGGTPLHFAANFGCVEMVEFLLTHKDIDVDSKEQDLGATPLHLAAEKGRSGIVRLLLDDGRADINATTRLGVPLHFAAVEDSANYPEGDWKEIVRLLLSDPRLTTANHVTNKSAGTPVMTALLSKSINTFRELVNHPVVDLSITDGKGRSLKKLARSVFFISNLENADKI